MKNERGILMDELKVVTDWSRDLIAKLVEKWLRKKFGYGVDIDLNELEATVTEEKAKVHLSVDVEIGYDELSKILEKSVSDKSRH